MKLKIGQILKSKKSSDIYDVKIIAEGGAMLDRTWYTDKDINEFFILPKEKWVPKEGEKYWFFTDDFRSTCTDNYCESDTKKIEVGNCYETQELCEQAIEKIKKMLIVNQVKIMKNNLKVKGLLNQ